MYVCEEEEGQMHTIISRVSQSQSASYIYRQNKVSLRDILNLAAGTAGNTYKKSK